MLCNTFAVIFVFGGGQEKDLGMSDQQVTSNISNLEPRIEIVSDTKQSAQEKLAEQNFVSMKTKSYMMISPPPLDRKLLGGLGATPKECALLANK